MGGGMKPLRWLPTIFVLLAICASGGCQTVGEAIIDAVFSSLEPTEGTSREAGISDYERLARSEEERLREMSEFGNSRYGR